MAEEKSAEFESLDPYVERLLDEKDLTNVDAEVLDQLKVDLKDRVEDRINVAIVDALPSEKIEEFDKVMAKGNETKTQKYLQDNIPNLETVIANELIEFRRTYLGLR
ncbi:DUF5663 domain-containing protein [Patescibacteria group bacterium]